MNPMLTCSRSALAYQRCRIQIYKINNPLINNNDNVNFIMQQSITLAVISVLLASTQAAATDISANVALKSGMKVYAGGGVGYTGQANVCHSPFFEGSCDDSAVSYKVFAGARFNPLLGAEVTYVDHGEAAMSGSVGTQQVASKNHITGFQITAVGYLPLATSAAPNLEVIGKAGVLFWQSDSEVEIGTAKRSSGDGASTLIGFGAQYRFHQNMSLRGEWEHTFGSGADSGFETDIDNYSMSLLYSTL